jgi:hypothetical protein
MSPEVLNLMPSLVTEFRTVSPIDARSRHRRWYSDEGMRADAE